MLIPSVCHSNQLDTIQASFTNTGQILCEFVEEGGTQMNIYWAVYHMLGTVLAAMGTKLRRRGLHPQETHHHTPTSTPGQPSCSDLLPHETCSQESGR